MISIFGLGYTFDFGFGAAIIRQLSIAKKENDHYLIKKFFFTFLIIYIFLSLIITMVTMGYYYLFLSNSSIIKNVVNVNINLIFIIISISFFFQYINNYLKIVFEGFSEFIALSKILFVTTTINTILIVLLYILKLDLVYLAIITLFIQFISLLIFFFKLHYLHGELSLDYVNFDFSLIRRYFMYGLNIQISSFVNGLIDPVIKLLIGSYLSLSFITFFETSKKIINLSNGLIFSAQKGIFNKLSEQHAAGTLNEYINVNLYYYSKMSNYYTVLVYGLLNPIICFVVFLWFKNYESVIILLIFFLPYALINYGGALYSVLMVDGKGIRLVIIQSINLLTTFLLLLLSLNYFGSYLGLSALYLAIAVNTIIIFYLLSKSNKLDYKKYLKDSDITDIAIMSIIIIVQILVMYFFSEYYITVLLVFLFIYFMIFIKHVKYFYNLFLTKVVGKIKLNN